MKKLLSPKNLPLTVAVAAACSGAVRLWFLSAGADKEGLLIPGHIANILGWILTALVVLVVLIICRQLISAAKYAFNFPPSLLGAIGSAAAAMGILVTSIAGLIGNADFLSRLCGILGILSALALLFLGFCRWKGLHCNVLMHGIVCVYLLVYLLCQYRIWSSQPQLLSYGYQLVGCICLLIAVYRRTCFDGNTGNRKAYATFRLLAAYFCLVATVGSTAPLFYLTCGFWSLTDMCNLTPMPRPDKG